MPTRTIRYEENVEVSMRDGTVLRADVWRPEGDGPFPAVLARTPYNKQNADPGRPWLKYSLAGYAVVVQDCRGRWASDGEFVPFRDEIDDGYDTVEWLAAQEWCTGKVGMYGTSYLGATQWLAACGAPPHLTTIVPAFTASDFHDGWIYHSGALMLSFAIGWALPFSLGEVARSELPEDRRPEALERIRALLDDIPGTVSHRPLRDVQVFRDNGLASYYVDWLDHPDDGGYWRRWSIEAHHPKIGIPVLSFGGWYDIFLRGTLRNFTGMRANGASEVARDGQRLVLGSWAHGRPLWGDNPDPDVSFGLRATGFDHEGLALRWFDHWLKGEDNGVLADTAPVTAFLMGENRWVQGAGWPFPETEWAEWYLHSNGVANTAAGDGVLSVEAPGEEPADVFVHDPRRPVPTHGGPAYGFGGARDQRAIEARPDVLVYTSGPLEEELTVIGPVTVRLWAATSARDTDFTAKLVDVAPDGLAVNLADGIVRARYRSGTELQEPVEPGEVVEYAIDLDGIANRFRAGHRIRLELASSNFPRFDANPSTGGVIAEEDAPVPALQTVFHSSSTPSHVRLAVVRDVRMLP